MLKIRDLTTPELCKCKELCNFTDTELQYFNLKAKDNSNIHIAHIMNVSESQVSNLSRRVRTKIKRIL